MTHPAQAWIDLKALRANLQRARAAAPGTRVLAVIKADGYGHGLVRVAEALHEADAFGVASLDEALVLREAGIAHPIVLLEGFFEPRELPLIARHRLATVVHHEYQLAILERADLPHSVPVWLKIDSGMHRLGFRPKQAVDAFQRLRACPFVGSRIRLMTHLANADDRQDLATDHQCGRFEDAVRGLEGERSIANSAAILAWTRAHADWVRPGIMLFGASPFNEGTGVGEGLQPVMTLSSKLVAINHCRRGDALGYGGSWVCPEDDLPIGIVAIGYGDGYPRSVAPGTPVLIGKRRASIVGRVSMEMVCVDLRGVPEARIGDEVVLWGRDLPVEEIARSAGTVAYELLCGVTQRVHFATR